eukprot:scaffold262988_cov26-Prasinocladus_malaysianus.AAC.2
MAVNCNDTGALACSQVERWRTSKSRLSSGPAPHRRATSPTMNSQPGCRSAQWIRSHDPARVLEAYYEID